MKATLAAILILVCVILIAYGGSQPVKPQARVIQLWNSPSDYSKVSSPVMANGFVYFASRVIEGSPATLCCVDASSGSQIWNKTCSIRTFTVAKDYVYLCSSNPVTILCLNSLNGNNLWNYSCYYRVTSTSPKITSVAAAFGTPVVDSGIIYVGAEIRFILESRAMKTSIIFALDALTGKEIWSYTTPETTSLEGRRVLLGNLLIKGGYVYGVSAFYSPQDWSWLSTVYALNASTGEKLWNYTVPGQCGSLSIAGSRVYVASNFVDPRSYVNYTYLSGILALNASDGARIWNYTIGRSIASPIIANDTVYAISDDGNVYALDTSNGRTIWHYATGMITGSPLLVNDQLFVGSSVGVCCFDTSNGTIIWNFTDSDYWVSSLYQSPTNPIYADGIIYFGWNGPIVFAPRLENNFLCSNCI